MYTKYSRVLFTVKRTLEYLMYIYENILHHWKHKKAESLKSEKAIKSFDNVLVILMATFWWFWMSFWNSLKLIEH